MPRRRSFLRRGVFLEASTRESPPHANGDFRWDKRASGGFFAGLKYLSKPLLLLDY